MQPQDGVIKFNLEHSYAPLPSWADAQAIQYWFARCRELDMIGQHPDRYAGAAYGNISQRAPDGFLITGTQTGGKATLGLQDICWVQEIDIERNRLVSSGEIRPSSESMTHEQIYRHVAEASFVIHVHHKPLWQQAANLGLAITATHAAYGTPEMAYEVERLLMRSEVLETGCFSMGGHEDGIVVFGASADQAGKRLENLVARLN